MRSLIVPMHLFLISEDKVEIRMHQSSRKFSAYVVDELLICTSMHDISERANHKTAL